jgi:hypothetical protein
MYLLNLLFFKNYRGKTIPSANTLWNVFLAGLLNAGDFEGLS